MPSLRWVLATGSNGGSTGRPSHSWPKGGPGSALYACTEGTSVHETENGRDPIDSPCSASPHQDKNPNSQLAANTTVRENSRKPRRVFRPRSGATQMAPRLTSGWACPTVKTGGYRLRRSGASTTQWRARQSNEGRAELAPNCREYRQELFDFLVKLRRLLKVRVAPGGGTFCAPYRNPIRSTIGIRHRFEQARSRESSSPSARLGRLFTRHTASGVRTLPSCLHCRVFSSRTPTPKPNGIRQPRGIDQIDLRRLLRIATLVFCLETMFASPEVSRACELERGTMAAAPDASAWLHLPRRHPSVFCRRDTKR